MNELDILKDVSTKLESAGIGYMLSGSMAMSYYTQPRMTRDIDIVVCMQGISSETFLKLFGTDYVLAKQAIDEAVQNESMFNIIHNEAVIKVDFIVRKSSPYRIVEFERRKRINVGDFHTYIVTAEDLVISKLDWMKDSGSELQRNDIQRLLVTELDWNYMESWISRLGLLTLYGKIKHA
jgi:hypothetical protein